VALRRGVESGKSRQSRLERALAHPVHRVIFVCHGNIMRSAFAVAWARRQFPALAERVAGAGTHAVAGRAAQAEAIVVARQFGAPLDGHGAQPLALVGVGERDLVVCMDRANEANAAVLAGAHAWRVFLVGDIAAGTSGDSHEVRDPYGRGEDATRAAFAEVRSLVDRWMERVARLG
jgi:protein-tyrosine-phosphatase